MVGVFENIKIFLGMKSVEAPSAPDKSVGLQGIALRGNRISYMVLPDVPAPKKQAEEIIVQTPEVKVLEAPPHVPEPQKDAEEVIVQAQQISHARELEQLKHYNKLFKQNKLDDAELDENWD
jgi:hypothetical protein